MKLPLPLLLPACVDMVSEKRKIGNGEEICKILFTPGRCGLFSITNFDTFNTIFSPEHGELHEFFGRLLLNGDWNLTILFKHGMAIQLFLHSKEILLLTQFMKILREISLQERTQICFS